MGSSWVWLWGLIGFDGARVGSIGFDVGFDWDRVGVDLVSNGFVVGAIWVRLGPIGLDWV